MSIYNTIVELIEDEQKELAELGQLVKDLQILQKEIIKEVSENLFI